MRKDRPASQLLCFCEQLERLELCELGWWDLQTAVLLPFAQWRRWRLSFWGRRTHSCCVRCGRCGCVGSPPSGCGPSLWPHPLWNGSEHGHLPCSLASRKPVSVVKRRRLKTFTGVCSVSAEALAACGPESGCCEGFAHCRLDSALPQRSHLRLAPGVTEESNWLYSASLDCLLMFAERTQRSHHSVTLANFLVNSDCSLALSRFYKRQRD